MLQERTDVPTRVGLVVALAVMLVAVVASPCARGQCETLQALGSFTGPPSQVRAFVEYQGDLIVGGVFSGIDGQAFNGIARWNGVSWQGLGSGLGTVNTLAVYNDELIAGGTFGVARLSGSGWQNIASSGVVDALAVYNGELIAGGSFDSISGQDTNYIASWDGKLWHPLAGGVTGAFPTRVYALAVYNNMLIAAGRFDSPGVNIASWNGSQWAPLGAGLGSVADDLDEVRDLTIYEGELFACGLEVASPGRWNGSSWQLVGGGTIGSDFAIGVYNGDLIIGGSFTTAGGQSAHHIARWNGLFWQVFGWSGTANSVQALTVYEGELFVGATGLGTLLHWSDCPASCSGDTTGDSVVDVDDLVAVILGWGACSVPCPPRCAEDVTENCTVDVDDLVAVILAWGPCS
jgi:trimeric autotransporter adhesin